MEILEKLLIVLHILGLSMILGGVIVQSKSFRSGAQVTTWIRQGVYTQLLTGVLLVAVIKATDDDLVNSWIAVKFGVALVILVLALVYRKANPPKWVVPVIGLLALANVVVAIFFH